MKHVKKFEDFSNYDFGRFSKRPLPKAPEFSDESKEDKCEPCGDEAEHPKQSLFIGFDPQEDDYTEVEDINRDITTLDDPFTSEEERDWNDREPVKLEKVSSFKSFISEKKKQKEVSYEESGLKNPDKADLDKNKKISGYEKARGKAVQDAIEDEKKEKDSKGLTAAQKKLPEGLRKAIEAKNKKKK